MLNCILVHTIWGSGQGSEKVCLVHSGKCGQLTRLEYNTANCNRCQNMIIWILFNSSKQKISKITIVLSKNKTKCNFSFPNLGIGVWNPSFDVTSAELITGGIVTEFGIYKPSELKDKLSQALKKAQSS